MQKLKNRDSQEPGAQGMPQAALIQDPAPKTPKSPNHAAKHSRALRQNNQKKRGQDGVRTAMARCLHREAPLTHFDPEGPFLKDLQKGRPMIEGP